MNSGLFEFIAIERVVYGKPAAQALRAEVDRLKAQRVFMIVSGTMNRTTDEVTKVRDALDDQSLDGRIATRVDEMFRRGLVAETRHLLERGLAQNPTAMQAIGYRQVVEHLRGERTLEATIELVKIRTRQFAKRQLTWFRKFAALEWVELNSRDSVEDAVSRIAARA